MDTSLVGLFYAEEGVTKVLVDLQSLVASLGDGVDKIDYRLVVNEVVILA
jgi:hypothetical protein